MKLSLLTALTGLTLSTAALAEPLVKFIANQETDCDEFGSCTLATIAYDGDVNVTTITMAPGIQSLLLDVESQIASTDTMTKTQSELLKLKTVLLQAGKQIASRYDCEKKIDRSTIDDVEIVKISYKNCAVKFQIDSYLYNTVNDQMFTILDSDGWIKPQFSKAQRAFVAFTSSLIKLR